MLEIEIGTYVCVYFCKQEIPKDKLDPNEIVSLSEVTSGFIILFLKFFCRFQIKKYRVKS